VAKGSPTYPRTNSKKRGLLPLLWNQLLLNEVKEADADVRIPPHRQRSVDLLVFSGAGSDRAYRKARHGRESEFVREWCLPLVCSGRAHRDGSSVKRIKVALVPGPIAKEVRGASAIVGDGGQERHRDLARGLSGAVFFLANDVVDVVWVAYAGAEVKDQREPAKGFCLGSSCDPNERKAYGEK